MQKQDMLCVYILQSTVVFRTSIQQLQPTRSNGRDSIDDEAPHNISLATSPPYHLFLHRTVERLVCGEFAGAEYDVSVLLALAYKRPHYRLHAVVCLYVCGPSDYSSHDYS